MFTICGKLKKLEPADPEVLIEMFNRIKDGRNFVKKDGATVTITGGPISTWKFLYEGDRLVHLIYVVDAFSVLWLGDDFPCPIAHKLSGYSHLLEDKVTENKAKKKITIKERKLSRQQSVIDILKAGGEVKEMINKKKR